MKPPLFLALTALCLFAPVAPAQTPPPLHKGLGNLRHKVTTSKPEAQKYFDQGLTLAYGFNHDEAYRSFEHAARLDPQCAMAYWGMAYVLGPNINMPMDAATEPKAYAHAQKALQLASGATPAERDYIQAMAKRYAAEGSADRSARDRAYADAAKELARKYPKDVDAQVLAAEAFMDLNPWNYWTLDKTPNPGTEELVAGLENTLKMAPNHVGAIHLYIHAVEASGDPGRALPYAEKLPKLTPGAGHLVHMPTHLYRLKGRWLDAKTLNQVAAEEDKRFIDAHKPTGMYPMMYYNHNLHFVAYASSMDGQSQAALEYARRLYDNIPSETVKQISFLEGFTTWPLLVLARFGRWEEILGAPAPPAHYRFTTAMYHYVRGLAFATKKQEASAAAERDSLVRSIDTFGDDYYVGLNSAKPVLRVAAQHLAGEIAVRNGRALQAVPILRGAVALEDSLHYDEPPGWYAPIRQYLGAAYLEMGKPAEAEAVYRQDLERNPNNGWSLFGLAQALRARGALAEAGKVDAQFQAAWKRADVKLTASRF